MAGQDDVRTVNEVTGTDMACSAANPAGGRVPGRTGWAVDAEFDTLTFPFSDPCGQPQLRAKISSSTRMRYARLRILGRWGRIALMGIRRVDVTFVEIAFVVPTLLCALAILWLLAYLPRSVRQDRRDEVRGLDDLDELGWKGWSMGKGWAPWTCWPGCAGFHRKDWWRIYLYRTCWPGCEDLHREDWWRVYLDQRG